MSHHPRRLAEMTANPYNISMSLENPFYHRGAIRRAADFYGREAVMAEILGLLRNGQSVSLIGPRRIGKSSLLINLGREEVRHAFQVASPQAVFVLIDCQELGGSPAEEVYDALYAGLLEGAQAAHLSLEGLIEASDYRALDRVLHQITAAGAAVVVLLDEFELLAANNQLTPHFFARLRGLTTKYGLAYLTASQRPLFAITADEQVLSSPFFNIFVTIPLGLFSPEEAVGLLHQRLASGDLTFSPPVQEWLLKLVGRHPFFLHLAGYHAFQALSQGRSLDDPAEHPLIEQALEMEADSHLSYLWNNLTPEEQYSLAVTDGPIDVLRQLEQQCLLEVVNGSYDYTSQILERFVRRQNVAGLIQADPFVIDLARHRVRAGRENLVLTTSQFALLTCLVQRAGQVVHGEDLERAVWGEVLVDDPDRLKTLIKRLRRAMEPYGEWIVSERGVGYALRPPDS